MPLGSPTAATVPGFRPVTWQPHLPFWKVLEVGVQQPRTAWTPAVLQKFATGSGYH